MISHGSSGISNTWTPQTASEAAHRSRALQIRRQDPDRQTTMPRTSCETLGNQGSWPRCDHRM